MATLVAIPRTLTTELVERLGRLWDQPEGVAEVALSTLTYGSRASLISHRVIAPVAMTGDAAVEIVISDYGRQLMRACAARLRDDESADRDPGQAEVRLKQAYEDWQTSGIKARVPAGDRPQRGSGEVPSTLGRELVSRLAHLSGQPEGVAEVALSTVSYGSRASLVEHGVIQPIPTDGDDAVEVVLTDYGQELIDVCAAALRDEESEERQRREAEGKVRRAYEQRSSRRQPDPIEALFAQALATHHEGRLEDAAALLWRLVETNDVRREVALAARVLVDLVAHDPDRNHEVVALLEKSVEIGGVVLGPEHGQTLEFQSRLGIAYHAAGDLDRATQLLEEALEAQRRVLGPEHPNTLDTQSMLALAYQDAGDFDRAMQLFEETLATRERVLGQNELETVMSRWNLGNAYMLAGDVTRGEALRAEALKVAQEQFASEPIVADMLRSLRPG